MSRIEKALERAMELRGSQLQEVYEEKPPAPAPDPDTLPKFEMVESILNKDTIDKHIVCITQPYSPAAEQYKKLRARVLAATKKNFLNTIMVTSSNMGEGKTVTAVNLAISIASSYDHTVLLVDADMRKPKVCDYLGIKPKYGLSDCLAGRAELRDAIIKTGVGKLSVMSAGTPPENPAEMLSSDKMKRLVQEMKFRYRDRYIIFDSPPVLVTADPLSLGNFVDGVILVVKADHTTENTLSQSVSLLKGFNIFGVVLNNMPLHLASAINPYYHHYYKGHDAGETVG